MEPSRLVALELDTCLELLRSHEVGRIALTTDSGPMILPVNYRFVETMGIRWIAIRTEAGGLVDAPNSQVAFEIDEIGPGHQGRSVLVRGTLQRVDFEAAGFDERFDSEPWLPDRDSWLVIEPYTVTGRELLPGAGDWAFSVGAYL
jgi:nitroimidazol reductase NimA-like FMN-containing flavoprotein (pyridoxamine 5'-phosphate oxidase superfamily)